MAGQIFYIKHRSSKFVCASPEQKALFKAEYVHNSKPIVGIAFDKDQCTGHEHLIITPKNEVEDERFKFRFIPKDGEGHFGYIVNVQTGRRVQIFTKGKYTKGGADAPISDKTELILSDDEVNGALFAYDGINETFQHISGKYWRPKHGTTFPVDGTKVILSSAGAELPLPLEGAQFKCVNSAMKKISPYPTPDLTGKWVKIFERRTPLARHEETYSCTIGTSQTKSRTEQHSWNISAGVAKEWFSANAVYSGYVAESEEKTWTKNDTHTKKIIVDPGNSVFCWQYVFSADLYDNRLEFRSSIIKDTNIDEAPKDVIKRKIGE